MELVLDAAVLAGSYLLFFLFASLFFSWFLFRDFEVKNALVQFLFSATFAVCCSMFEIVIFEILDVLGPETRRMALKIQIWIMNVALLSVLPAYFFFVFSRENGYAGRAAIGLSSLMFLVYLYTFYQIGLWFPITSASHGLLTIEQTVGRFGVLGVAVIAFLSGYGAINTPYVYLQVFWRRVDDRAIADQERRLLQTMDIVLTKKKGIVLARRLVRHPRPKEETMPSGLLRVLRWLPGLGSHDSDLHAARSEQQLAREARTMEEISRELFDELNELRIAQDRGKFSSTCRGRLYDIFGYFFSVYCLYKMTMCTVNILFSRDPKNDPVSRGLELFLYTVNVKMDVAFWSQQISFLFIGILVLSSVRGFLIALIRAFDRFSSAITSNTVALLLSMVMGMYFTSYLLLMRMNLPIDYRRMVTEVLGDIQFNFYHRWFDVIFVVSSVLTVTFLFFTTKLSTSRNKHYPDKLS